MDKNLMIGLISRNNVLSTNPDGSRRNDGCLKQALATCFDQFLYWALHSWIWKLLGINLLVANKNDILSGR